MIAITEDFPAKKMNGMLQKKIKRNRHCSRIGANPFSSLILLKIEGEIFSWPKYEIDINDR